MISVIITMIYAYNIAIARSVAAIRRRIRFAGFRIQRRGRVIGADAAHAVGEAFYYINF